MPQVTDPLLLQSLQQQQEAAQPRQVTDPNTIATLAPSFGARLSGEQPGPLIPPPDENQSRIWPVRRDPESGFQFDPYAGVLGSLLRGLTAPGDVATGRVPITGPGGGYNPDMLQRGIDTAAMGSPISPSYRAGARYGTVTPLADDAWMPGWRGNLTRPPGAPPPAQEIKTAADTGYTAVRESGLETPSNLVVNLANQVKSDYGARFSPESAKSTFSRLDLMADPKRSGTSMADLMAHYDDLTSIIGKGGPDASAAYEARQALKTFMDNLGAGNTRPMPGATPTMAPEQVSTTLEEARGNTRAAMAANKISGELDPAATGFIERAEGRSGPGRKSMADQLSDRATKILESNKEYGRFTPDEIKALEKIRDGTATQNVLEWWGRRFGGVGPASAITNLTVGAGLGGGLGWKGLLGAIPAQLSGEAAKAWANAMARGNTRLAEELARRNSPLAQGLLASQPLSYSPGIGRDAAVVRAIVPGLFDNRPPPEPPGGWI
jgi:hypothetical protein